MKGLHVQGLGVCAGRRWCGGKEGGEDCALPLGCVCVRACAWVCASAYVWVPACAYLSVPAARVHGSVRARGYVCMRAGQVGMC